MSSRVAVVTDSTSGLSGSTSSGQGITVVPLHVLFGAEDFAEGVDISAREVAERLRAEPRVSTSRPSPRAFLQVYEKLASQGAEAVLSVHLPAQLSGTCEAATLAARDAPLPVRVVDTGLVGAGLGRAVTAAARVVAEPRVSDELPHDGTSASHDGILSRAVETVARISEATVTLFYVHTLEFLRRGGRIGAASAFLGGALAVKPLLELSDGHIEPVEKLRTQGRALSRLLDIAVERAEAFRGPVGVVVHHVDAGARAETFAEKVSEGLDERGIPITAPRVVPLPAVLAAHVGPGALGCVLMPAEDETSAPVA